MGFWSFLGKMWLFNHLFGDRHDNNVSYPRPSDSAHDYDRDYSYDDSYGSSFDNDYSSCDNCSHDDYNCDPGLDNFDNFDDDF